MKYLFIILLIFSAANCVPQTTPSYNQKAIDLNNKAVKEIMKPGIYQEKLRKANEILDSAIKIDPKYPVAYQNKISNLISLKDYKSGIKVADLLLEIQPLDATRIKRAVMIEKTGDRNQALQIYKQVYKRFLSTFNKSPTGISLTDLSYITFLIEGKEKAFQKLKAGKKRLSKDDQNIKMVDDLERKLPTLTIDKILGVNPDIHVPLHIKKKRPIS